MRETIISTAGTARNKMVPMCWPGWSYRTLPKKTIRQKEQRMDIMARARVQITMMEPGRWELMILSRAEMKKKMGKM